MPAELTPVDVFTQWVKEDPKTSGFILGGFGLLSVAAIVMVWNFDLMTMVQVALYLIGLSFLLVLARDLPDWMRILLQGFIVLLLIASLTTIFISCVTTPAWPKPAYCLVEFWKRCSDLEERFTDKNASSLQRNLNLPPKIVVSSQATGPTGTPATVSSKPLSINFAGLITRETITALNASLKKGGWNAVGPSGVRTGSAVARNELLYGDPQDKEAAEELARSVTATKIGAEPIVAKPDPTIGPNALELWISN